MVLALFFRALRCVLERIAPGLVAAEQQAAQYRFSHSHSPMRSLRCIRAWQPLQLRLELNCVALNSRRPQSQLSRSGKGDGAVAAVGVWGGRDRPVEGEREEPRGGAE